MTSCIVTCLNCLGDEGCNISIQLMCKSEIDSHQYAIVFQITMFLEGKKEVFLFYNALNTFYFRLYAMGHMVKDHSDSERGNPLPPTRCHHIGYSFQLSTRVLLHYHPTDRMTHTMTFVTPVVEHWLEREIAQWVHHEGSIR